MIQPSINTPTPFVIDSANPKCETGIWLKSDASYLIEANPDDWWVDFYVPCHADGYEGLAFMKRYAEKRILPNEKWFAAGGLIQGASDCFLIGLKWSGTPHSDGQLIAFANDIPGMYWNNWGRINFMLTRLA